MTALQTIDYPITKADQCRWAADLARPLMEGEVDPLEFITKLKGLQAALSEVEKNKEVRDLVLQEISKHGKEASWHGARLVPREVGVKYDYSRCNDPIYARLLDEKAALDAQLKERESFLKSVPAGTTFLDPETGEVYELYPAVRMATESYAVTFKKE